LGRVAGNGLVPVAPGVEKGALDGENAVKSGQKQRRTRRRLGFEQRNQLERQASGAEQATGGAGFVKGIEPVAGGCRILLPGGSCRSR